MGRDSATFRNKETTGAQNLAMGRDGPGRSVKIRDGTGRNNHYSFPIISCFRTSFPVLERPFPVLERPFPVLERPFPFLE